jgi:hypothetical protein
MSRHASLQPAPSEPGFGSTTPSDDGDGFGRSGYFAPPQHDQGDHFGPHAFGQNLGWGDAVWSEPGGFESALVDHLPAGIPVLYAPVDHLDMHNTFVENNVSNINNMLFTTGSGGSIEVGGDLNAISDQSAQVTSAGNSGGGGLMPGFELFYTGNPYADSNWADPFGPEAVLFGHLPAHDGAGPGPIVVMPIHDIDIDNTFIQNNVVQTNNMVFDAHGGTIDIHGDLNAVSSQHALIASVPV